MDIHSYSLLSYDAHPEDSQSLITSKQALADSTNTQLKTSPTSSTVHHLSLQPNHRRSRHTSSKRTSIGRYKNAIKRKNQFDTNSIPLDNDLLQDMTHLSKKTSNQLSNEEQNIRMKQRAMYNARQTPLIPLITDLDFSMLVDSSEEQNDLLINILTLLSNVDKECSFFEQFNIDVD